MLMRGLVKMLSGVYRASAHCGTSLDMYDTSVTYELIHRAHVCYRTYQVFISF